MGSWGSGCGTGGGGAGCWIGSSLGWRDGGVPDINFAEGAEVESGSSFVGTSVFFGTSTGFNK